MTLKTLLQAVRSPELCAYLAERMMGGNVVMKLYVREHFKDESFVRRKMLSEGKCWPRTMTTANTNTK